MNILIVNHYAGSEELGMEYRPFHLARHWVRMGHRVLIVAAGFTHLRLKNPTLNAPTVRQVVDGVEYLFLRTAPYTENDRKRALNVLQFVTALTRMAPKLAADFRPQVVIASSTYPYDIHPAGRIAKLAGAKLVFEVHDIWPQSPIEIHGYHPAHPLMIYTQRETDYAFQKADLVVSLLPFTTTYMKERGYRQKAYLHIPNGVEPELEISDKLPQKHLDLLGRYREKGMFIVLYVGGFSMANALEDFIKAAGKCPGDVLFATVGNGPLKVGFKKYARLSGVHNLLFLDGVPREQIPAVLRQADCLYLGAKETGLYRYGVSMNKLFDYMKAAKPIIYGVSAANNPVADAGCGLTIQSEDPAAIVAAVETLRATPEPERIAMGERGRAYVLEHHSYPKLAETFLAALEALLTEKRGEGE